MKKFYYILLLLLPVLAMTGCSDESLYEGDSDSATATLSYRVSLDEGLDSRAIGDGAKVNQLKVGIFQDGKHIETKTIEERVEGKFPVEMTLLKNLEYTIVFWAQAKDNGIYTLDENTFEVGIDYSKYTDISLEGTEYFEAFYAKDTVTLGNNRTLATDVKLTRPFAQLNIAAKEEDVFNKVESASLTIENVYTGINLLKGQPVGNATGKTLSFNYSDEDATNKQSIKIGEDNYYYVASAYLFSPEKVKLTGELFDGSKSVVKSFEFPELTLKPNYRTNIYGEMIQMEELAPWDGITFTQPEFVDNKYVIDEEADLAWLSVADNTAGLSENSTFVVTKGVLDMDSKVISSIQLPAGSTFDGNNKTIKNFANSLFGNATKVSVKNLTIENAVVPETGVTHVGVLMNTLSGSATFENVTVINSTANTTNGAAGGFVGYIKNDDTEELSVNFTKCTATGNNVSGSLTSGVYVGRFRGYKNAETLTFSADCNGSTATFGSNAKASYYITDNAACWFTSEQIATFSQYSGWLGCEEYYRGTVNYGDKRYIPKWDGTTKVTPLTEGTTKLIYSAFDLASLQGSGHTAVTFKEDVDLGGDRASNKNPFTPISTIGTLDGENHKLYNLNIFHKSWIVGFINGTSGTETIHKNLHFVNSSVRANMTGSEAQVYVGTLCPYVNTKYTVSNITMTNGYVLGLGKVGGLIGFVTTEGTASLECNQCKVESSIIENIQGTYKDVFGFESVGLTATFNPHGEAGGLIGFLGNDATITECQVNNCNINCYGQDDQTLRVFIFSYTIPGRHVNRFIGDIMTINGDAIVIRDCSATGNTFGQRKEDRHSYRSGWSTVYCDLVGQAYYLAIRGDTKGSVKIVNGTTSTTIF